MTSKEPARSGDDPAPRVEIRTPVYYRAPKGRGQGTMWDVSSSGARIELASPRVRPGIKVKLEFTSPNGWVIIKWGSVVRETESGFAVRFSPGWSSLDGVLRN